MTQGITIIGVSRDYEDHRPVAAKWVDACSRTCPKITADAEELLMATRLSTGITGLDQVLHGGLLPGQNYMIRGTSGAGKTTLAMQFLMEGARRGEAGLFIGLTESEEELRASVGARGWSLDGIHI